MLDIAWNQAQGPWGPMDHMGWGWWVVMALFWIAVLVLVVWLIVFLVRRAEGGRGENRGDRSEAILRERYARGELDEDTYRRMMDELRRS